MRGVPLCFLSLSSLCRIGIGRNLKYVAVFVLRGQRGFLILGGQNLDLNIVPALSFVVTVIPDTDITRFKRSILYQHSQSFLRWLPVP